VANGSFSRGFYINKISKYSIISGCSGYDVLNTVYSLRVHIKNNVSTSGRDSDELEAGCVVSGSLFIACG